MSIAEGQTEPFDEHHVEGRTFFDSGLPAESKAVRLYSRGFGEGTRSLAKPVPMRSVFALPYNPDSRAAKLRVCLMNTENEEFNSLPHPRSRLRSTVMLIVQKRRCTPIATTMHNIKENPWLIVQVRTYHRSADTWTERQMTTGSFWEARAFGSSANIAAVDRTASRKGSELCPI